MIIKALKDILEVYRDYYMQALLFGMAATVIFAVYSIVQYLIGVITHRGVNHFPVVFGRIIIFAILSFYSSFVVYLTLSGREAGSWEGVNFKLFSTLIRNGRFSIYGVENILLFVPLGILVPALWPHYRKWYRMMLLALLCSSIIEWLQLVTSRGFLELDDVILNTLGAMIGYLLYSIFASLFSVFSSSSS